jgi:Zn-dependent protease
LPECGRHGIVPAVSFFIQYLVQDPFYFFSWVGIVAFSVCFHEYAHASVAYRLGDDTAASAGHLSLNPLVQMGPMSLVMLALFGIAWGAVPVNPGRLRSRAHAAAVSFAGPASNFLLAVFFSAIAMALVAWRRPAGAEDLVSHFFVLASMANGVLFVFNMLPVPVFDGWAVASLLVPRLRTIDPQRANTISSLVLLAVFLTPVGGVVWTAGTWVAGLLLRGWGGLFRLFV